METNPAKKVRIFRDEETIRKLLDERKTSKVNVKVFCAAKGIAEGAFHNWKKRYGTRKPKRAHNPNLLRCKLIHQPPLLNLRCLRP